MGRRAARHLCRIRLQMNSSSSVKSDIVLMMSPLRGLGDAWRSFYKDSAPDGAEKDLGWRRLYAI